VSGDSRIQVALFGGDKFEACFENAQMNSMEVQAQTLEFVKNKGGTGVVLTSETSGFSQSQNQSQTSQNSFSDILVHFPYNFLTVPRTH
jgi:hypothetical protein